MSGAKFESRVTVYLDDKTFVGCGRRFENRDRRAIKQYSRNYSQSAFNNFCRKLKSIKPCGYGNVV